MSLIDELAFEFNKSKEEIRTYLLQAPSKYKVYLIAGIGQLNNNVKSFYIRIYVRYYNLLN